MATRSLALAPGFSQGGKEQKKFSLTVLTVYCRVLNTYDRTTELALSGANRNYRIILNFNFLHPVILSKKRIYDEI